MIKYSKHIITVSEYSKKEISDYFGVDKDKISIVYNGVDNKFKPKKLPNQDRYILGVSSVAYHKNIIRLIESFLLLKNNYIKLYIVGSLNKKIYGKESLKIINLAKKNQNIKYLGRVDDDKLIELYSNAVCFVYPSLYEGFGIPPLEAQACGCPIVISDIPVFKEVYANSALFFNPYDPEDMAKKIENIIDSSNMRKELIQKGFKNVKKYTWENSARQFFNILNKVIKND